MLQVGKFYGAVRWSSEAQAKTAWEHVSKDLMGCSVWRVKVPFKPPHTDHLVIIMGEDEVIVTRKLQIIASYGGETYPLDKELVKSLQTRRLRHALDGGGTVTQRNANAALDRVGRFFRP